jgi:hypothetical protein
MPPCLHCTTPPFSKTVHSQSKSSINTTTWPSPPTISVKLPSSINQSPSDPTSHGIVSSLNGFSPLGVTLRPPLTTILSPTALMQNPSPYPNHLSTMWSSTLQSFLLPSRLRINTSPLCTKSDLKMDLLISERVTVPSTISNQTTDTHAHHPFPSPLLQLTPKETPSFQPNSNTSVDSP